MSKHQVVRSSTQPLSTDQVEPARASRAARLMPIAVVAVALVAAYWPALHGGLLWDDDAHITKPELRSAHGLWRIWFELGATQQYYPLTHSIFWAEQFIWGDNPLGYHFTNLLMHGVASLLFFRLLQRLHIPGAELAATIFALHPVMVESVAWITELKNTLSAVCFLAASLVYINFDAKRRLGLYFLAFSLFVFALLSKSVTATLPAVLLVVFWYKRGKLSFYRDVVPLLPWFVVGSSVGLFTAWVEKKFIGAAGEAFALSAPQRTILAGRVICFYLRKIFWPADLMFVYPRWTINGSAGWECLYLVVAIGLLLIGWVLRNQSRGPLSCVLLYAGMLFPVLGFFNIYPFLFSYVADHFQYLPSLSVIAGVTAAWTLLQLRLPFRLRLLSQTGTYLVVAVLWTLTSRQCRMYVDARTLYRATLAHNPACWMAHSNLGDILVRDGALDEGIAHYKAAVERNPNYANIYNNMGYALMKAGRLRDAIAAFEEGLKLKPQFAEMRYNLGDALLYSDRAADAIEQYVTALRLKPEFTEVHCNLAYALFRTGQLNSAVDHYKTALEKYSNSAPLHFNLGITYLEYGQAGLAREQFDAALRIDPEFKGAQQHIDELNRGTNPAPAR